MIVIIVFADEMVMNMIKWTMNNEKAMEDNSSDITFFIYNTHIHT